METQQNNQPEKKFSTGAINATVWKNVRTAKDGQNFEVRTISIQRRYADRFGKWQSTNSLRPEDLPKVALVVEEAYKYLMLNGHDSDEPTTTPETLHQNVPTPKEANA